MISPEEFCQLFGPDGPSARPIRAWVVEETNGKVRLSLRAGASAGQQWHARLAGTAFEPGTEVLALPLDERNLIVLGAIKTTEE